MLTRLLFGSIPNRDLVLLRLSALDSRRWTEPPGGPEPDVKRPELERYDGFTVQWGRTAGCEAVARSQRQTGRRRPPMQLHFSRWRG